jgi:hypothetical protein
MTHGILSRIRICGNAKWLPNGALALEAVGFLYDNSRNLYVDDSSLVSTSHCGLVGLARL